MIRVRFGEFLTGLLLAMILLIPLARFRLIAGENLKAADTLSRMKCVAIALAAYSVDHDSHPPCGIAVGPERRYDAQHFWEEPVRGVIPGGVPTIHSFAPPDSGAAAMVTFRIHDGTDATRFFALTTPVAYMREYPADPFARTRGATFSYFPHANGLGWMLASVGPDRDENASDGPGDIGREIESYYDLQTAYPYMWRAPARLINATYDPTNGLMSEGDIYWTAGR